MNRDSELVAVAAAGGGRMRLLAPAMTAAGVCAVLVAVGAAWAGPAGLAKARVMITEGWRADVVTSIVQPGRFIEIEDGLTVHIRDRLADGSLAGLLLDDARQADLSMTYLAETGRVLETDGNTLLVMTNGSVQRMERPAGEALRRRLRRLRLRPHRSCGRPRDDPASPVGAHARRAPRDRRRRRVSRGAGGAVQH